MHSVKVHGCTVAAAQICCLAVGAQQNGSAAAKENSASDSNLERRDADSDRFAAASSFSSPTSESDRVLAQIGCGVVRL